MYLGVDYYPEHWDFSMIDSDMSRMREMGVNIVRIGEFAWHLMEREEGIFDFSFFDKVIEKAKHYGLKIMFGTPTATFPAWLAKRHPAILSEDIDGHVRVFGGRRQYCFNSRTYWEYSKRIVTELVKHYQNEEAIIAWQIDNEFGHEGSDFCYCCQCHKGFQKYLEEKYKNIDILNETYGTIFWGQTYNSFDEIPVPKNTITTHNPSLLLDWARFRSYSINSYAAMQIELVRKLKGSHQQITHNFYGGFFDKCYDQNVMAQQLDFASYDNYPVWGGLKEPLRPAHIAMTHDYVRGLKNDNYWIVEELMGAQGHTVIGYLPRPNQAKLWSYQAIAHGCSNLLYFRWRGMNKGAEQYCLGIIDHNNRDSRKYYEVQSFFKDIRNYEEVVNSKIKSKIAVLYSFDNIWSWKAQPQSVEFDFTKELVRLYTPFYNHNTNIDVISVNKDFSGYEIVVVPVMKLIDKELAKRLGKFAANGGTVIFSYRTGIKNDNNNIYLGKVFPGYVKEMCGLEIEESESLQKGQEVEIVGQGNFAGRRGNCEVWRDLIIPTTAETLFKYNDKFYNDKACVTVNEFGQGKVYYIGGGVNEEILDDIIKVILEEKAVEFIKAPKGLEIYNRNTENGIFRFIMNHNEEDIEFDSVIYKPYESKIIKL